MITLTEEQIEAGRMAAMQRTGLWKPTPLEAVALARRLFELRGKFTQREAKEVAALIGWSDIGIWNRYLCGELGLPTPKVERALAFAAGQHTYTRADGSVRYVNDDHDYHHDRATWAYEGEVMRKGWWSGARITFDGLTQAFVDALLVDCCPCCGVEFRSGGVETSPSIDHLVPGVRSKENARLLCYACNRVKQDALPETLHRVAQWMMKTPDEMLDFARTLPAMPRRQVDGRDRWKEMLNLKKGRPGANRVGFSLTLDDMPFTAVCPVLGVLFLLPGSEEMAAHWKATGKKAGPTWSSPSFDRIDPRKGYVAGNVVLVSNLANKIMNNCTSPDRVRIVAEWFERELAAAPELAALIDYDAHDHWKIAAE